MWTGWDNYKRFEKCKITFEESKEIFQKILKSSDSSKNFKRITVSENY